MTDSKKRSVLNPRDVVIVSRERLQEVFDDAVARGRMTRDDASELVSELVRKGLGTTQDTIADIEQLLGRSRDQLMTAAGLGSGFPIANYDELSAADIRDALDGLTPAELRKVRDHERRNANRKTVLQAIESRLS